MASEEILHRLTSDGTDASASITQQQQQLLPAEVTQEIRKEQLRMSLSTLKLDEVEDQVGKGSPNADSGYSDANNNHSIHLNQPDHGAATAAAHDDDEKRPEKPPQTLAKTWSSDVLPVEEPTSPSVHKETVKLSAAEEEEAVDAGQSFHYVAAQDNGKTKMETWKSWGELPREDEGSDGYAVRGGGAGIGGGGGAISEDANPNHLVATSVVDGVYEGGPEMTPVLVLNDGATIRRRPHGVHVTPLPLYDKKEDKPVVKRIHSPSGETWEQMSNFLYDERMTSFFNSSVF